MDGPGFDGAKYVFTPPLREKWHQEKLWQGLAKDDLQVVSTDHCPFCMKEQKELGKDDFTKIPNGGPGIEHRVSLVYSGGVHGGKFSANRFVQDVYKRQSLHRAEKVCHWLLADRADYHVYFQLEFAAGDDGDLTASVGCDRFCARADAFDRGDIARAVCKNSDGLCVPVKTDAIEFCEIVFVAECGHVLLLSLIHI